MWYDASMPRKTATTTLEDELKAAERAVEFAQQVRASHRRRTDKKSPQRAEDIGTALKMLKEAMKPLRSRIGRFASEPLTVGLQERRAPIYAASLALQAERRKLWKMLSR